MGFLSGWTYRKKLTIDSTKVNSSLTNFPVSVQLKSSNFDFTKAKTNGDDIRFTSSDGTTLLKFEREFHGTDTTYGSNFCTGGTATAKTTNPGDVASNAFDSNTGTWWTSSTTASLPTWLKYDLGISVTKTANRFTVTPRIADANAKLVDFKLQGSNDDSTWDDLYAVTSETWPDDTPKTYDFANSTAYRYYRLYITSTSGGVYAQVVELEIMEATEVELGDYWVKVPSVSSSADTYFYIYYDNPLALDAEDPNNVWDSNFKSVMHLKESGNGTVGEYIDSTSNANDGQGGAGVSSKVPTQINGKIYKGQDFDGGDLISIPDSVDWDWGTSNLTISFWV